MSFLVDEVEEVEEEEEVRVRIAGRLVGVV